jgi:hypothetical protein
MRFLRRATAVGWRTRGGGLTEHASVVSSRRWMESCRKGKKGGFSYRCYGRDKCPQCRGGITLFRAGGQNRITYFCGTCQSRGASLVRRPLRPFWRPFDRDLPM